MKLNEYINLQEDLSDFDLEYLQENFNKSTPRKYAETLEKAAKKIRNNAEKKLFRADDLKRADEFSKRLEHIAGDFRSVERRMNNSNFTKDDYKVEKLEVTFLGMLAKHKPVFDRIKNSSIVRKIGMSTILATILSINSLFGGVQSLHSPEQNTKIERTIENPEKTSREVAINKSIKIGDRVVKEKIAKDKAIKNKTIESTIQEISKETGVPISLIKAIIKQESGGVEHAINKNRDGSTDVGIMQVNNSNVKDFTRDFWVKKGEKEEVDFKNPHHNIKIAVRYLADSYKYFKDWDKTIMAYNCGLPKVARNKIPSVTKDKYLPSVKKYWAQYEKADKA